MTTDLRTWWNTLDPFWVRVFKIMVNNEFEYNRAKRDAYVPSDQDLINLTSRTEVSLSGASVTRLKPLLAFSNLQSLSLSGLSKLTSIEELPLLPHLKYLVLGGVAANDHEPLGRCTGLESLRLANGLTSLELIKNLTNLKELSINESGLQNLSGIENLTNLTELSIHQANFNDFAPIAKLTNLRKLYIINSNMTSIDAIVKLTNLTELRVDNTPISSLEGIEALKQLQVLNIPITNVVDLTPLRTLSTLKGINIVKTRVTNLEPISKLQLQVVQLSDQIVPDNEVRKFEKVNSTCTIKVEKGSFPFRLYHHYRVIKQGAQSRGHGSFEVGQELSYDRSDYNHYDDIEICYFKDLKTKQELRWDCHSQMLDTWKEFFEKIEYKN
jgi:Leucine Rich repeats (2 copies)